MIQLETDNADPSYEFDAPDMWPDTTPPGFRPLYDAQVFAPDRLSLKVEVCWFEPPRLQVNQAIWLYAPFFILRPLTEDEQTLVRLYRDLLLKRDKLWDRMTELHVSTIARRQLIGPDPPERQTQVGLELQGTEETLEQELNDTIGKLRKVYFATRLGVTPILLKNVTEPHAPKKYLLYKNELWSSMRSFTDCEWAPLARCQARVDYDLPVDIESFVELGNDNFNSGSGIKREFIPEEVRFAVWRRDQGRCAKCDSRDKLEFDHIIPVSRGGSSTVRNIELLCESCNRKKGASIS